MCSSRPLMPWNALKTIGSWLPLAVLEELDSLKSAEGEAGRNARQTIRYLESLRLQGNLLEGVTLQNGGSLRLEVNCVEVQLPKGFPDHKNDNRILKVCLGIREKERPVILVTKGHRGAVEGTNAGALRLKISPPSRPPLPRSSTLAGVRHTSARRNSRTSRRSPSLPMTCTR